MDTPVWFDQSYYLSIKVAALNAQNYQGLHWDNTLLLTAFTNAGLTPYAHYEQFGSKEGLNPNAYFDQTYYLQEKTNLLNTQAYAGRTDWTPTAVLQAITSTGMSVYDHFSRYGVNEGLDPSAAFSCQAYLTNKAAALNAGHYLGRTDWTAAEVESILQQAGLDPLSHFMADGLAEGISPASGNAYALSSLSGNNTISLKGIIGSPVTATLAENHTVTITSTAPSSGMTFTGTSLTQLDASGIANSGAVLTGNSGINVLTGTGWSDTLCGGKSEDFIHGGGGGDTIVYHFGDSTQESDSIYSAADASSPDVVDFTPGSDKLLFETSSNATENPSTIYCSGVIYTTENYDTNTYLITFPDGTTKTYSTLDAFETALYTAGVTNKNSCVAGSQILGANEATLWNVDEIITSKGSSFSNIISLMAVNNSDAIFNDQDVVISFTSAYAGIYNHSGGIIGKSLFFGPTMTANNWFDEAYFLVTKADELNSIKFQGKSDWNAETVKEALQAAGQTPEQNYTEYSAFETGVDPNRNFSTAQYYSDKARALNRTVHEGRSNWTAAEVSAAFRQIGLDPVEHYLLYGKNEGLTPKASSDPNATTTTSTDAIIGALTSGSTTWNSLSGTVVTYSFMTSTSQDELGFSPKNFIAMDATQQHSVALALDTCSQVTGIQFAATSDPTTANILFATSDLGIYAGEAYYPAAESDRILSEVFIDNEAYHTMAPTTDAEWFETLLHEVGHAMGLKHPFDAGSDGITLARSLDNTGNTLMSYTWTGNNHTNYQAFDVLALEFLYGTDGIRGTLGIGSSLA